MKNLFSITVISLIILSCKTADQRKQDSIERFGYIDTVEYNNENIERFAKIWGIDSSELYFMDIEGYKKTIWAMKEENKRLTHDLYQWHQLFIFDKEETLISYQLNCRTEVDNDDWQWNSKGTFNTYPPADNSLKKFNKDLTLDQLSPYFIGRNGTALKDEKVESDFIIIVYWSIYRGRQSKNLISTVNDYKSRNPKSRIKYLFVNNDNYYSKKIASTQELQ